MKYISILRGINVSGQKSIKMADLKLLYKDLGFENIVTYIQSGNVIFDTAIKNPSEIKSLIEKAIHRKYKFDVPVLLRTNKQLDKVIAQCPFKNIDYNVDGAKVLVTFSSVTPSKQNIDMIQQYVAPTEKLVAAGKEIYLYCPNGYGKSKLSNAFLEARLNIEATTRNMKSVKKLHELSL